MPEKIIRENWNQKENQIKQNAEIVNHMHEIYWNICNELEVTISSRWQEILECKLLVF